MHSVAVVSTCCALPYNNVVSTKNTLRRICDASIHKWMVKYFSVVVVAVDPLSLQDR